MPSWIVYLALTLIGLSGGFNFLMVIGYINYTPLEQNTEANTIEENREKLNKARGYRIYRLVIDGPFINISLFVAAISVVILFAKLLMW